MGDVFVPRMRSNTTGPVHAAATQSHTSPRSPAKSRRPRRASATATTVTPTDARPPEQGQRYGSAGERERGEPSGAGQGRPEPLPRQKVPYQPEGSKERLA